MKHFRRGFVPGPLRHPLNLLPVEPMQSPFELRQENAQLRSWVLAWIVIAVCGWLSLGLSMLLML
jgi:hypothetical protein